MARRRAETVNLDPETVRRRPETSSGCLVRPAVRQKQIRVIIQSLHIMLYFRPVPNIHSRNGEVINCYTLMPMPADRLSFNEVCRLIAHRTTLTEGEVAFVLTEVAQVVVENIEDGRGTELGALGSVEISAETQSKPAAEELTLDTVKRVKLIYKPSLKIKKALKKVRMRIKREYSHERSIDNEEEIIDNQ